jgi:hypothetical protein
MSDPSNAQKSLRERLSGSTEERLGRALSELLENPLLTGAIGRAFDAREKASQAQEVAMGALNIPSAADIERLTRRLRSVSHRLEGIEDGVQRLDRALSPAGVDARLSAIEDQLDGLTKRLGLAPQSPAAAPAQKQAGTPARKAASAPSGRAAISRKRAGKAAGGKAAGAEAPRRSKAAARKAAGA